MRRFKLPNITVIFGGIFISVDRVTRSFVRVRKHKWGPARKDLGYWRIFFYADPEQWMSYLGGTSVCVSHVQRHAIQRNRTEATKFQVQLKQCNYG